MPSERAKELIRAKLAELKERCPAIADILRLSKSGDSIAEFDPERPDGSGTLLYTTISGVEDRIVCAVSEVDGNLVGLKVERQCYEGFPDPPRTEPKFRVGDRVRMAWGPRTTGRVDAVQTYQGADREWYHRLTMVGPGPYDRYEASESFFERVEPSTEGQGQS
jgi:hypothetical protein